MPEADEVTKDGAPTTEEKDALKTLVRGIVLAQGNIFIKELLRQKNIKIGVTKADFEQNMLKAIEDGKLRQSDVEQWLHEVEGWGDQHVYLYRVPPELIRTAKLSDGSSLERALEAAGLKHIWNAQTSLEFPETRKLTGAYFDGASLRLVWHQGLSSWVRDKAKDYQEETDSDLYEFRAYRGRAERSVMRFELRLAMRLAAVFIQVPWNESEHANLIGEARDALKPLLDFRLLKQFPVALAIKKLDQAQLSTRKVDAGEVGTQSARLSGTEGGAYVEFVSTSIGEPYTRVESIRRIRQAAKPEHLRGSRGMFLFRPSGSKGLDRQIKFQLYGKQRRVRLWAQMTSQEVWQILEILKGNI